MQTQIEILKTLHDITKERAQRDMSKGNIEKLKELYEKTTQSGKWQAIHGDSYCAYPSICCGDPAHHFIIYDAFEFNGKTFDEDTRFPGKDADADFLAAAHNAFPALYALIKQLREENARLREPRFRVEPTHVAGIDRLLGKDGDEWREIAVGSANMIQKSCDDRNAGAVTMGELKAQGIDIATLKRYEDALRRIRDHTDADDENSYRADDGEGCLDTVHHIAKTALNPPELSQCDRLAGNQTIVPVKVKEQ